MSYYNCTECGRQSVAEPIGRASPLRRVKSPGDHPGLFAVAILILRGIARALDAHREVAPVAANRRMACDLRFRGKGGSR